MKAERAEQRQEDEKAEKSANSAKKSLMMINELPPSHLNLPLNVDVPRVQVDGPIELFVEEQIIVFRGALGERK